AAVTIDEDGDVIEILQGGNPGQPQPAQPGQPAAAKPDTAEAKALEAELKTLQRNVTLGRWADVKTYLAGLPEIEGKEGYAQMLKGFGPPPGSPQAMQMQQQRAQGIVPEQHVFALDDVMGLAAAA